MIKEEEVYPIGRIGRTHGIKGEVTMQFDDDVFDRADADYIFLRIDGILVPFFFEEYRFRSDTTAIVKFNGIDTQERARQLTGCEVLFPRELTPSDDDQLSLASLVGYTIVDATTECPIGRITDINDQTANILFEMEDGSLIPAAEDLITAIDTTHSTITMQLPEGLLNL